jgi:hypothetical protein
MTINVKGPDGSTVAFPDGTPEAEIVRAMDTQFGAPAPAAAPAAGTPAAPASRTPDPTVSQQDLLDETPAQVLKGVPIAGAYIDQAGAAVQAAAHPVTGVGAKGGTWRERYTENLRRAQQIAKEFEAASPGTSTTAKALGAGLSLTAGGAVPGAARVMGLTGSLPSMAARSGAFGGALGAADAAVRGEDPTSAAAIGAGVGAAAPPVARALGVIASPIVQPIAQAIRGARNPEQEAARRVIGAVNRDVAAGGGGVDAAEFAAGRMAGTPTAVMDVGGETTRALARSAANTSPEGRAALTGMIDERFEGQGGRVADWLNRTFHYPDAAAQQEAIEATARNVNAPRYRRAYDDPGAQGMWDEGFEQMSQAPEVQAAIRKVLPMSRSAAAREGFTPIQNPFHMNPATGRMELRPMTPQEAARYGAAPGTLARPNLEFWDRVKRELDKGEFGGRDWSRVLRGHLDELVPAYREARAGAAHFFGAENALEAGQAFVTSKMANPAARAALHRMSDTERQLFQDGFVSRFIERINEMGDRRSVLNFIANTPAARERLMIALGPQRSRELEAMLRVEGIMDLARPAVQGNSTTARQLAELGLAGGVYTVGTGGNVLNPDPTAIMNAALVYGAARGKARIDERVARRVAEMLASRDPQVFRNGVRAASSETWLDVLRRVDARLAQVAGLSAASAARPPAAPSPPQAPAGPMPPATLPPMPMQPAAPMQ